MLAEVREYRPLVSTRVVVHTVFVVPRGTFTNVSLVPDECYVCFIVPLVEVVLNFVQRHVVLVCRSLFSHISYGFL